MSTRSPTPTPTPNRTILVVGANKGIGFAIVQLLATRSPKDHFLLGARDPQRGKEAITRLRDAEVTSAVDLVVIDITSDESIYAAEKEVRETWGGLDVLINNAAIALSENDHSKPLRSVYQRMFDINVASIVLTTETFLPLLRETSPDPRVIQISSARGSMTRIAQSVMPPPWSLSYGATKAALNLVTLEMAEREEREREHEAGREVREEGGEDGMGTEGRQRQKPRVVFQCVSPGHCRTDFNNNTGRKEPIEGARVVAEVVLEDRERARARECGLWEIEGEDTEARLVPW